MFEMFPENNLKWYFLFLDMNKVHQLIPPIDSLVILVSLVTTIVRAIYIYTSETAKTNMLDQ